MSAGLSILPASKSSFLCPNAPPTPDLKRQTAPNGCHSNRGAHRTRPTRRSGPHLVWGHAEQCRQVVDVANDSWQQAYSDPSHRRSGFFELRILPDAYAASNAYGAIRALSHLRVGDRWAAL